MGSGYKPGRRGDVRRYAGCILGTALFVYVGKVALAAHDRRVTTDAQERASRLLDFSADEFKGYKTFEEAAVAAYKKEAKERNDDLHRCKKEAINRGMRIQAAEDAGLAARKDAEAVRQELRLEREASATLREQLKGAPDPSELTTEKKNAHELLLDLHRCKHTAVMRGEQVAAGEKMVAHLRSELARSRAGYAHLEDELRQASEHFTEVQGVHERLNTHFEEVRAHVAAAHDKSAEFNGVEVAPARV